MPGWKMEKMSSKKCAAVDILESDIFFSMMLIGASNILACDKIRFQSD